MSRKKYQIKKTTLGEKDQQIFKIYSAFDAVKNEVPIDATTLQVETKAYPEAIVFSCTAERSAALILKLIIAGEPNVFYKTIQVNSGNSNFTIPYILTRNSKDFTVQIIGLQNNLLYHKEFSAIS